jgi:hypothetical protein
MGSGPELRGGTDPIGSLSILWLPRCYDRKIGSSGTFPHFFLVGQWRTAATKPTGDGGAMQGRYRGVARRASTKSVLVLASSAPFEDALCRTLNPPRATRRRKSALRRLLRHPVFRVLDKRTAADRIAVCSLNKTGGRKPDTDSTQAASCVIAATRSPGVSCTCRRKRDCG